MNEALEATARAAAASRTLQGSMHVKHTGRSREEVPVLTECYYPIMLHSFLSYHVGVLYPVVKVQNVLGYHSLSACPTT